MVNWEISIIELNEKGKTKYKVTKRLPALSVSKTKVFKSRYYAVKQFEQWLIDTP